MLSLSPCQREVARLGNDLLCVRGATESDMASGRELADGFRERVN